MNYLMSLATLPAIGGVIVGALAMARGLGLKQAVPMSLDLLTAAGLLRLSQDCSWQTIACAGAIIALRKILTTSLSVSTNH